MTETPSTPPSGQADDPGQPMDIPALRAAAELHMLDVLRVPAELLPPSLSDGPVRILSAGLRRAVQRRMRIADRLHTAAGIIAAQAIQLIDVSRGRPTPAPGHPIVPAEVARVTELTAQLREMDRRLTEEAGTLVSVARAYAELHGDGGASGWVRSFPG